jgi:HEAT repeat protein
MQLHFAVFFSLLCPHSPGNPPTQNKNLQLIAKLVNQLGNIKDSNLSFQAFRKLQNRNPKKAIPLLIKAIPSFPPYPRSLAFSLLQSYPRGLSQPALHKLVACGIPAAELAAGLALYHQGDKSLAGTISTILSAASSGKDREALLRGLGNLSDKTVQTTVRGFLTPQILLSELDATLFYLLLSQDPLAPQAARNLLESEGLHADSQALLQAFLLSKDFKCDSHVLAKKLISNGDFYRLQKFLIKADKLPTTILTAVVSYLKKHSKSFQARYAIEILAKNNHRKSLPLIRKLVGSKQSMVSEAAFDALQKLGGLSDRASFYQFLKSKDPSLALGAADTLRRLFPYKRIDLASTGYLPTASPAERADSVARLRAWWSKVSPQK